MYNMFELGQGLCNCNIVKTSVFAIAAYFSVFLRSIEKKWPDKMLHVHACITIRSFKQGGSDSEAVLE